LCISGSPGPNSILSHVKRETAYDLDQFARDSRVSFGRIFVKLAVFAFLILVCITLAFAIFTLAMATAVVSVTEIIAEIVLGSKWEQVVAPRRWLLFVMSLVASQFTITIVISVAVALAFLALGFAIFTSALVLVLTSASVVSKLLA